MNLSIFTGNLGGDAVVKDAAGKKVMEFSVGVAVGTKDTPQTLWVKCSKWSEKTALQAYLLKGTKVCVTGTIGLQTYKNQAGETIAQMTLRVDNIELLGSKQDGAQTAPVQSAAPQQAASNNLPPNNPDDGNLPF